MSKFNSNAQNTNQVGIKVTNAAGCSAVARDYKNEVAGVVLNSMLNGDNYYESDAQRLSNLENLLKSGVSNEDTALFLAKAMVYTRTEGNLRSVSHFMGNYLAENAKCTSFLRPALVKTMIRPDDATEMVSLFNSRNKGVMIPSSLRRAIKDVLETKWDEYQLTKYKGTAKTVKLRDLVKLSHPSPAKLVKSGKAKDVFVFKRLIEDKMGPISTAQTVNAASTGTERATNYKAMLRENKLGYMAAIKNIRNIVTAGADTETIDLLCTLLTNQRAVLNSKLLPFRFIQAYDEVKNISADRFLINKLLNAIEQGFIYSARNVEIVGPDETVAIMLDESGSMGGSPFENGKALMAALLTGLDKNKALGYLWADYAREVDITGSPMSFIQRTRTQGSGTDLGSAIRSLTKSNTKVDKLVIITDMQHNSIRDFTSTLNEYKSRVNSNVKVLFWNIQGYGKGAPVKMTDSLLEMSGFSDKLLEVGAKMFRYSDKDFLVKEIEAIQL